MKRISLLAALTLLAPALCHGYISRASHCRIRFSPHAFSYHNSGLVPGGVRYSPHAMSYRNSGLVYAGTRYSPYALSYRHSGLVVDYCHRPVRTGPVVPVCPPCCIDRNDGVTHSADSVRRTVARRSSLSAQQRRHIRETDGLHVIRRYLADQGIRNVEMNYRLGQRNRTACVAFILRDRNLAIEYRNPEVLQAAKAEADYMKDAVERHDQRWETFASKFVAGGGTVYRVTASDRDKIVAALDACGELNETGVTVHPATMYAQR